jgi:hypothetical protein
MLKLTISQTGCYKESQLVFQPSEFQSVYERLRMDHETHDKRVFPFLLLGKSDASMLTLFLQFKGY